MSTITAAQAISELKADIKTLVDSKASRDDVEQYKAQLTALEQDTETKINEIRTKAEEAVKLARDEAKARARGAVLGGGEKSQGFGKQVVESDAYKSMVAQDASRSGIVVVKNLHTFLARAAMMPTSLRAITDLDPSGITWEHQDKGESANLARYFEPGLRSLIPSIRVSTSSIRYPRLNKVYHLAAEIASTANSGQKIVTLKNAEGVKPNSTVTLSPGKAAEEEATVSTIDHDTGAVTMLANLTNTHAAGELLISDDMIFTPKTKTLPKAKLVWDSTKLDVAKLGFLVSVTREEMMDAERFQAELEQNLPWMIERQFDKAVLYGDGGDRDLAGVFKDSGVPQYLMSSGSPGDRESIAVRRALTISRKAQHRPDLVHIHPDNLEDIEVATDDIGRFMDKLVVINGELVLWRLRVREDHALVPDDFLVASWQRGAKLYFREDTEITMSTENNDNFETDMVDMKIRERLALALREPNAFVRGKFDSYPS